MQLIALMGRSQSGKDTVGRMLTEALPGKVHTIAFADKLKQVCMDLFGLSWEDVYTEEGKARPLPQLPCLKCLGCGAVIGEVVLGTVECPRCHLFGEAEGFKSQWTPRMILQHVGTEGLRFVDANVWVKFALREAARHLEGAAEVVAITDCRFRSEAEAVWRAGGQVWRIRRPATDNSAQGLAGHASEREMDTIPDAQFQRVIVNDGTLDVLRDKVGAGLASFLEIRR